MPSTTELRSAVAELALLADADLEDLWKQVNTAMDAKAILLEMLPLLVDTYGTAAASLAADWYDELRDETEQKGRFTAITADVADAGTDELARWAVTPLFAEAPAWDTARVLVSGGLQRRIANAARDTITVSSIADPRAAGWQRVASSSGCGFCQMLAGRGAVYSEKSADFSAHDHCNCGATVAWKNAPIPVKPYTPTARNITDADRARTREWIAANL